MSIQARKNATPERQSRSALHCRGLRFWVHRRPVPGLRREADVVFPRARVAVFVDDASGMDVLSTPRGRRPTPNGGRPTRRQPRATPRPTPVSRRPGWLALRVREHEAADEAAERAARVVTARRS